MIKGGWDKGIGEYYNSKEYGMIHLAASKDAAERYASRSPVVWEEIEFQMIGLNINKSLSSEEIERAMTIQREYQKRFSDGIPLVLAINPEAPPVMDFFGRLAHDFMVTGDDPRLALKYGEYKDSVPVDGSIPSSFIVEYEEVHNVQ